jgi:D-glycero-alpha-D-manno-heptose-7-phosphate kinase
MIITQTPYRVSLFGGGTDFPAWYKDHGGAVISFTIDKFCFITLKHLPIFFDKFESRIGKTTPINFRLLYSRIEEVGVVDEIQHPAIREGIRKFAPGLSLELTHHGDLPARSGVGSSSAFAVGLIKSLNSLNGIELSKEHLAKLAIEFEQKILHENVGSQDQIACTFGGLNTIDFRMDKTWTVNKISLSSDYLHEFENSCVLVYSGIGRSSSDVSESLLMNLNRKQSLMKENFDLVSVCRDILLREDELRKIGPLLNKSWEIKKRLNPRSSTPTLEALISKAEKAGALGGKVLGAGGGGFCLFWVDPPERDNFINSMKPALVVPVKISFSGSTQLV